MIREFGVNKDISFHCSRHGFATLALCKGMPIESVSRILGHTNIETTQIYAKITVEKLDNDLTMLGDKLSKSFGNCTVPDHVGYKPVVGKFLNLYEPISHVPRQGDFLCIRSLVGHIFGEQYELGMDYLQLLYLCPVQKLPILLLVSEERNTGKSTFQNFLKAVLQKQRNVQHQRGHPQPVQFRLGWQAAHHGGRGAAQPP